MDVGAGVCDDAIERKRQTWLASSWPADSLVATGAGVRAHFLMFLPNNVLAEFDHERFFSIVGVTAPIFGGTCARGQIYSAGTIIVLC